MARRYLRAPSISVRLTVDEEQAKRRAEREADRACRRRTIEGLAKLGWSTDRIAARVGRHPRTVREIAKSRPAMTRKTALAALLGMIQGKTPRETADSLNLCVDSVRGLRQIARDVGWPI